MIDDHNEAIVDWAESSQLVKYAKDRPWYNVQSPSIATEFYQPPCHCKKAVRINRYTCEDGAGYIYLGQCDWCQAIIWSFMECKGK